MFKLIILILYYIKNCPNNEYWEQFYNQSTETLIGTNPFKLNHNILINVSF